MSCFIGDSLLDCRLWIFGDADYADEFDSRSTTGCMAVIVGPNTYDPELDEIRYGGMEPRKDYSASSRIDCFLNEKFKVAFCEDNQATIHIIQTGNSAQLRHADRTQRTSVAWLREQFSKGFFNLVNVNSVYQVADILAKPFTSKAKWDHACHLIGVRRVQLDGNIKIKPAPTSEAQASAICTNETYDRLLREFCCSDDSKLGDKPRSSAYGCKVLRVTER